MTAPVIHRVTGLDLAYQDWHWPFAEQKRAEIDAHFARRQSVTPQIWNGRVLLGRNPVFSPGRFEAQYFETDFASLLAWIDWGFPDKSVFNGFGMGALRSADGAFVLGEMSVETANAGRIYFPSGTPDRDDLRGAVVDIAGSVVREVEEETGLTGADYRAAGHWDCVVSGSAIAIIQILESDLTGTGLRSRIEANLAAQTSPELSAIHLVRHISDVTPATPAYVRAFLAAHLAPASA
jgi:8-oxo-dGTP pyrophosphatase MutT (NUDIX family)